MISGIKKETKSALRKAIPLPMRKRLCVWLNSRGWLSGDARYWWTMELLRDFREADRNGFHKFLWSNHLAYADTYTVEERFGPGNLKGSRRLFFSDLEKALSGRMDGINSVFEVGCSLGYQLRSLEEGLLKDAEVFEGIDIDSCAIEQGAKHLGKIGSKVRLYCCDMEGFELTVGEREYDLSISTGVLMYLDERTAEGVVKTVLTRTRVMAAFAGLAHPEVDNSALESSSVRGYDGSFVHNIDRMVRKNGWQVALRRWEGPRIVDGQSIYFVFAVRAGNSAD